MNVLSLFDGISCGYLALQRAGIKVDNYYACEIKKDALEVSKDNFPNIVQLGDVNRINFGLYPTKELANVNIDLLIGGSPCQQLSGCNRKQVGLVGVDSNLFYEYVRILRECNPRWFLLENVASMKQDQKDIITRALGVLPIRINSKLVSAQLRDRLYWTNIPNVTVPADKGIELKSILTSGYTNRSKARCLLESDSRPLATPEKMIQRYINGFTTLVFEGNYVGSNLTWYRSRSGKTGWYSHNCRYLNQTELERLQTLPDGYTKVLNRNKAAGVIGDAWTVDVISHIFSSLI